MDNLVLVRVAAVLDASLARSTLREWREEGRDRTRLVFQTGDHARTVVVSLRPELPWIGRPAPRRGAAGGGRLSSFGAAAARALRGVVLDRVVKPGPDRVVRLEFADGHALVAELATHGANLVLVDAEGKTRACARHPRSSAERLSPGTPYRPPRVPPRLLVPFGASPEVIEAHLALRTEDGQAPQDALRRHLFGVGTQAARLVVAEAGATGRAVAEVLVERLRALERGALDPAIEAAADPLELAETGAFEDSPARLLPWPFDLAGGETATRLGADAAATAGLYHEAVERALALEARARGLRALVDRELARVAAAREKAERDLRSFEDPERHRRWGEALLAGLSRARRSGDALVVPDPYDPGGAEIAVPAPAGADPRDVADDQFRAHRRARRGLEQAAARLGELASRRDALERVAEGATEARGLAGVERLEAAMREAGLPVGLGATRRARAAAASAPPRLEGVRVFRTAEGWTVLVGKGGRENQRLTFRLAAAEDFWMHALGCRGAHVVLRNEDRRETPPRDSLLEAAALAAWYSEARAQQQVDVQWTQRKNVRKARGAPPGTVLVKRFRTVRVRPAAAAP